MAKAKKNYTGTVIAITQRHINRSKKLLSESSKEISRCEFCPISLATKTATGRRNVTSAGGHVTIGIDEYDLPVVACKFMRTFDNGLEPVKPTTFRLGRRIK